jgi:hypothetical protein
VTITLDAIDQLRERADISYSEAREALEQAGGDVVEALVYLEANLKGAAHNFSEQGKDLYVRAKHVAAQMHQTRMKVKVKDQTLVELPVTISALGAAVFPKLAALGVIGLLVSHGSIEVSSRDLPGMSEENVPDNDQPH